jgi:hypothetical protein
MLPLAFCCMSTTKVEILIGQSRWDNPEGYNPSVRCSINALPPARYSRNPGKRAKSQNPPGEDPRHYVNVRRATLLAGHLQQTQPSQPTCTDTTSGCLEAFYQRLLLLEIFFFSPSCQPVSQLHTIK